MKPLTLDEIETEIEYKFPLEPGGYSSNNYSVLRILETARAALRVVEAAKQPVKAFEAMQKDHDSKLGGSFEEASNNWNSLLQETMVFGPLLTALLPFRESNDMKGGAND